jgi:hypothetical protein
MNEERTGNCLRQVEHIHDHLWHRYFITVNPQIFSMHVMFMVCRYYWDIVLHCYRKLKKNLQSNRKSEVYPPFLFCSKKYRLLPLDRVTLKTAGELRCSGMLSSSCSTSGTRGVNLITNPVISHEWGKDWELFTISLILS